MNNEEVRLECSPKLVKGHSEVNCAHPPLDNYDIHDSHMIHVHLSSEWDTP